MKDKIEYLLSVGFKPMSDDPGNTLFIRGKHVIAISKDRNIEDIKREVENVTEMMLPNPENNETEAGAKEGFDFDEEEEGLQIFKENSENVDPTFIAESLKNVYTPLFRRLTLDGNRYYYRQMDNGDIKIYASGTNLIKDGYADNKDALNEWKSQLKMLGRDPEKVAEYEADKGTIMHYLFGLYLMGRDIYLRRGHIVKLIEEEHFRISKENLDRFKSSPADIDDMIVRLRKFAKFCEDYKVKPLLIEKILSCEEYEVASPIDLVCQMTTEETIEGYFGDIYKRSSGEHKAGDPKLSKKKVEHTFYAVVDFKSGGIYPSYAFQLELYRRMVNTWYKGIITIEKIYNFSPKSDSSKGYTLRDQTDCKELRKADYVYGQGMINHQNKNKTYKMHVGKLNINSGYREEDHTVVYDIAEELRKTFES